MKNIEKYKKEVIARLDTCQMERMIKDITGFNYCGSGSDHCTPCAEYVYKWLLSEYKEPILNDTEREYLSAVIKPFRNRVNYITKEDYITKEETFDSPMEFIHIDLSDGDIADFPNFKANTMYKGMELDKSYTLQELGL